MTAIIAMRSVCLVLVLLALVLLVASPMTMVALAKKSSSSSGSDSGSSDSGSSKSSDDGSTQSQSQSLTDEVLMKIRWMTAEIDLTNVIQMSDKQFEKLITTMSNLHGQVTALGGSEVTSALSTAEDKLHAKLLAAHGQLSPSKVKLAAAWIVASGQMQKQIDKAMFKITVTVPTQVAGFNNITIKNASDTQQHIIYTAKLHGATTLRINELNNIHVILECVDNLLSSPDPYGMVKSNLESCDNSMVNVIVDHGVGNNQTMIKVAHAYLKARGIQ